MLFHERDMKGTVSEVRSCQLLPVAERRWYVRKVRATSTLKVEVAEESHPTIEDGLRLKEDWKKWVVLVVN